MKIKGKFLKYVREPKGVDIAQVPQFVCLTFDDNGMSGLEGSGNSGGMNWLLNFVRNKRNPSTNKNNPATFDGSDIKLTFFMSSFYIEKKATELPEFVRKIWLKAYKEGHEIGVHTHNHFHGSKLSKQEWLKEIKKCIFMLSELGIDRKDIVGFRAPYLEYNKYSFEVIKELNFLYDSSIEEGWEDFQDGTNYFWPYTLDEGSLGHEVLVKLENKMRIGKYPLLWELPVYTVIVPPDEECEKYGVKVGFRNRMKKHQDYFDVRNGKISGLDYNLLVLFRMTKEEFLATLKYSFDLRLKGNRAPFIFCGHSDIYAEKYQKIPNISLKERQQVIEEFIDYVLSKPEVRIVSLSSLLGWLRCPVFYEG